MTRKKWASCEDQHVNALKVWQHTWKNYLADHKIAQLTAEKARIRLNETESELKKMVPENEATSALRSAPEIRRTRAVVEQPKLDLEEAQIRLEMLEAAGSVGETSPS